MSGGPRALLDRALRRRERLRQEPGTTAFRWLNGAGDAAPGLTLDVFGDVAVLSTYDVEAPGPVADAAMALLGLRAVYLKARPREAGRLRGDERAARAPALPLRGEPVTWVDVQEQGLRFRIRPGEGLAVGLYLDTRDARGWVRRHAEARTLLNCFSYTGAFGVAARAGGAMRAVDIDLSRRSLAWAEENALLNEQRPPETDRLAGDVFDWLRRFGKRGEQFDAVVCGHSPTCLSALRISRSSSLFRSSIALTLMPNSTKNCTGTARISAAKIGSPICATPTTPSPMLTASSDSRRNVSL